MLRGDNGWSPEPRSVLSLLREPWAPRPVPRAAARGRPAARCSRSARRLLSTGPGRAEGGARCPGPEACASETAASCHPHRRGIAGGEARGPEGPLRFRPPRALCLCSRLRPVLVAPRWAGNRSATRARIITRVSGQGFRAVPAGVSSGERGRWGLFWASPGTPRCPRGHDKQTVAKRRLGSPAFQLSSPLPLQQSPPL